MIHVCSLARLHETVEETRRAPRRHAAQSRPTGRAGRGAWRKPTTSSSAWTTSPCRWTATSSRARSTSPRLIEFVRAWERAKPMVVHCFAGISRSTAGAYVAACALNPRRDELMIAAGASARLGNGVAQHPHRVARRPDARPRRPHGRGDRLDRARRDGLRGRSVPARSGIARPAVRPMRLLGWSERCFSAREVPDYRALVLNFKV